MRARNWIKTACVVLSMTAATSADAQLAKDLFGNQPLPAATEARVYGSYSKGCFAGGMAIASDGPNWQAMRPSRNRRWGHPNMVRLVERLSRDATADGWPGLLVGDISQPRGGPMLSGHASHQLGLDADIWFQPMPQRRLSAFERENLEFVSMLRAGELTVDDRKWSPAHAGILRRAASYPEVERILVHPGIKKKLCDTVTGPQEPRARDVMRMADLPRECAAVLQAPAPQSEAMVTIGGPGRTTAQTGAPPIAANAYAPTPETAIPLPFPRPQP